MDTVPGCVGIKVRFRIAASNIVRISSDVFQQTGDFCYINRSKLPNPPRNLTENLKISSWPRKFQFWKQSRFRGKVFKFCGCIMNWILLRTFNLIGFTSRCAATQILDLLVNDAGGKSSKHILPFLVVQNGDESHGKK